MSAPTPRSRTFAVDERLVMPETRYEVVHGRVEYVNPGEEPHGNLHGTLAGVIVASVRPGYTIAVDMLTRANELTDAAPDVSVYRSERTPEGGRQLEELAFEVVSTERLSHAAEKARDLVARGIRGFYAIDVKRKRALVWSSATDNWQILDPKGVIEDDSLVVPIPIADLVNAVRVDDAMARALIAKKNPVIDRELASSEEKGWRKGREDGRKEGRREGRKQGREEARKDLAETIVLILLSRGVEVDDSVRTRVMAEQDSVVLRRWAVTACAVDRADELFETPG